MSQTPSIAGGGNEAGYRDSHSGILILSITGGGSEAGWILILGGAQEILGGAQEVQRIPNYPGASLYGIWEEDKFCLLSSIIVFCLLSSDMCFSS